MGNVGCGRGTDYQYLGQVMLFGDVLRIIRDGWQRT